MLLGVRFVIEPLQALVDLVMPLEPFLQREEFLFLLFGIFLFLFHFAFLLLQVGEGIPPGQPFLQRFELPGQLFLLLPQAVPFGRDLGQLIGVLYRELPLTADLAVDGLHFSHRLLMARHDGIRNPSVDGGAGDLFKDARLLRVVGLEETGEGVLGQDAGLAELVVAEPDQFHDLLGDRLVLGDAVLVELVDQIPRYQGYRLLHAVFVREVI